MKRSNIFLISFLLTVLVSSLWACDNRAFKKAKEQDESAGYLEYLDKYPNGIYVKQARDRLESLAFEQASRKDTIQSYQEYLQRCPSGRFRKKAEFKIEELAAAKVLSSNDIKLIEKYLADYPSGANHGKVHSHLLNVLIKKLEEVGSDQELKAYLKNRTRKHSSKVYFEVKVRSWYDSTRGTDGYKTLLEEAFKESKFKTVDNKEDAQILVEFSVNEKRGDRLTMTRTKDGKEKKISIRATDIRATVTASHLILKERLYKKSYKGELGLMMTDFNSWESSSSFGWTTTYNIDIKPGEEPQEALYRSDIETFVKNPYFSRLPRIISVALGETTRCRKFYELIENGYGMQNEVYLNILKSLKCPIESDGDAALIAIAGNKRKTCLNLREACMKKLCAGNDIEKVDWILAGNPDPACLCKKLKENIIDTGLVPRFLNKLKRGDKKEFRKCLQSIVSKGPEEMCRYYYEDPLLGNIKKHCEENVQRIIKSYENLQ